MRQLPHDATTVAPAVTAPARRIRRARIPKPDFDKFLAGKNLLYVRLMLPVMTVVAMVAQVVEVVYRADPTVYGVVMSPYWCTRTLWRACRPVATPEALARRTEARETIRTVFGRLGVTLLVVLALAAIVFAVVAWIASRGD
ncbi:hypothetical protein [Streptomyces sp. I05A-00742]|uniref:hypothetical protein n=1 Tax=Streptomyces sp. I05A-00742 TaxID=2732853 RepID=UPI001489DE1F|nr:hypothetical protein [Streptomyces sp. I05A-00742]